MQLHNGFHLTMDAGLSNIFQFQSYAKLSPHTVFPQIVSSLEQFPLLEQFPHLVRKLFKFSLNKGKLNEETTVFPHIVAAATILN